MPVLLVGAKNDLAQDRKVSLHEAMDLGKHYEITNVVETSAKTGENVEQVFKMISRLVNSKTIENPLIPNPGAISLGRREFCLPHLEMGIDRDREVVATNVP